MKKYTIILFIVSVFCCPAFSNAQKYYTVQSDQWQMVNDICQLAGVSGPSSNGPLTATQLLAALNRAESVLKGSIPEVEEVKRDLSANRGLFGDGISFLSISPFLNVEGYFQSNPHDTPKWGNSIVDPDAEWLIKDSLSRRPVLGVEGEMGISDFFYGRIEYSFIQNDYVEGIWNSSFSHNLSNLFSQNFPYDSGVSIGNRHISVIAAKGRRSIGRGFTGNTAIGDVYNYQEYLKAGVFSDFLGVILAVTNFDSSNDISMTGNPFDVLGSRFSGNKTLRYESSIEWNFFEKFSYSITMITLEDSDGGIDLRAFNPFYIMHNMFNFGEGKKEILEANNMLTMDFSLTPFEKWNLYFQFTIDQSQTADEVAAYVIYPGYVDPDAKGYLANISYVDRLGNGIFRAYAEFVYNSPGLYLAEVYYSPSGALTHLRKTDGNPNPRCWALDYLIGYHRVSQNGDDVTFSGYRFGPDVIVGAIGFRYTEYDKLTLDARLMYMAHGEKGRGTDIRNYSFDGIDSPSTYDSLAPTGIVEHAVACTVELRCRPFAFVETYVGLEYSYRWNYMNVDGLHDQNLKFAVGAKVSAEIKDIYELFAGAGK